MTRGTTPTFEITVNGVDTLEAYAVEVYFRQGAVNIKREFDFGAFTGNIITASLTQEETREFSHTRPVYVQVRVKNMAGQVAASESVMLDVEPIQSEEAM